MCARLLYKRQKRAFFAATDIKHNLPSSPVHSTGDFVFV
jgi:hypothetical protein